ncbi:unnamed protein product [Clavelina lepadiformis]|uniref:Uncharacterized protein n=1 Tax=Clavelina lepadiformis TaxID=159417 RepID=A0ABP0FX39_CLALP
MSKTSVNSIKLETGSRGERKKFELKKNFGLWSGVALIIGNIVGSGIFVSPVGVLKSVHGSIGVCLLVWVGCGVIAMMSALCYCELGASLQTSGGEVISFHAAYGPALSFMFIWNRVMINPGDAATLQVFGSYLLSPLYSDGCTPPDSAIKLIAILLLCFLTYLNCVSVKKTVKFEIAFSITKFLAMALIASAGIACLGLGNEVGRTNFQNGFAPGPLINITAWDVGMAFYQGNFSYTGYTALYFICEEIRNVKKNLPRATIIGLSLVIVMYISVNIGYLSVLTVEEIISSKAVAVSFGKKILGPVAFMMPLFVCFSTMGNQNGVYLADARLPFAAGRSGLMPRVPTVIPILLVCLSIFFVVVPFLRRPSFVIVYAVIFYILTLIGYYLYVVKKLGLPGSRQMTIFLQKLLQCAETDWDGNEFEKAEN